MATKILPILFSTDMVRALLDGKKTVTRRVVKPQPTNPRWNQIGWLGWDNGHGYKIRQPYQPGDILHVRETWGFDKHNWLYKADFSASDLEKLKCLFRWHPSIHMPKKAARIFLRATDVRVERIQDMTEAEARAEGFERKFVDNDYTAVIPARMAFADFWDDLIKPSDRDKYGWNANPWVWVIAFERCKKPDGWPSMKIQGGRI